MKPVLLIVTRAELGGAQRVALELALNLRRQGRSVTVAAGEEGWLLDEAGAAGIPTHVFRHLGRGSDPTKALRFVFELRSYLEALKDKPVVHLNSSNALAGSAGAKLAGCRVVFTMHGLSVLDRGYEANLFLKAVYWLWFRLWFSFVDGLVAVSTGNAERLKSLHLGDTDVIPNGIGRERLAFKSREEARSELGIPGDAPVAITVGRLEYSKQQDLALFAWKEVVVQLPEARLVLVGDGPDGEELQKLATRLGLGQHVVFAGARPDAATLVQAGDLFMLTSRYEGWPMAILEALAAGMPVIATDVGGIREQVGDAGILVDPEDGPDVWASQLTGLLLDTDRRAKLAEAARARSALWDAAGMTDRYVRLYED